MHACSIISCPTLMAFKSIPGRYSTRVVVSTVDVQSRGRFTCFNGDSPSCFHSASQLTHAFPNSGSGGSAGPAVVSRPPPVDTCHQRVEAS